MKVFTNGAPAGIASGDKIRIAGNPTTAVTNHDYINGREFTVSSVDTTATRPFILINTTGMSFPDDGFTMPQIMLIKVVLPAPFGPSIAKISPFLILRFIFFKALKPLS